MRIPQALYAKLIEHALLEAPLECCGMIACENGLAVEVYPCTNAAESEYRYEIDGLEQMRVMSWIADDGLKLGAIYHSHTIGPPIPSPMDLASAFYPNILYLIIAVNEVYVPRIRAFTIRNGRESCAQLAVI